MKKTISLFLNMIILISAFALPASAEADTQNVPAFITFFEKHGTNFVSLLGRAWNMLVKTDEASIPSAPEFNAG